MQAARSDTMLLIDFSTAAAIQMTGYHMAPVQTCVAEPRAESIWTNGLQLSSGGTILDAYVRVFDRLFVPYNGPDEPPTFEPED